MIELRPDEWGSVARWHFAVGGLQTQMNKLEIAPSVWLERLKLFPTQPELAFSLDSPLVAGIIQHYGESVIQHELVIDAEYDDDPRMIQQSAGAILAGLRIRTEAELICPAVCDHSWSQLRGITGNACRAWRVEPAMYAHDFNEPTLVTPDDFEWVRDNLLPINDLREDDRFNTALDALSSYLHAANHRMMAAQLWAGVEALFAVRFEISYRLPILAALFLKPRGPECQKFRKHVKDLYRERGDVVHGGKIDGAKLRQHVNNVRTLLARLLAKIIQDRKVPSDDDFDDLVLMPDSP